MNSCESMLTVASRFVSVAIVTFLLVMGGMWVAKQPAVKDPRFPKHASAAHWMFWVLGRDLDEELRNPKPAFDFEPTVVPAWDSNQFGDLSRYFRDEQEKRDRLMEEIRSEWGPH